jgi:hypothetical protein
MIMLKALKLFVAALALCGFTALAAHAASDYTVQGNMLPTTLNADYTFAGALVVTGNLTSTAPATEVIGAGGTITADACGGVKAISATAARTTDTTNSFTAPSAALSGCCMVVFNADDTDTITIDENTLTDNVGTGNLAVTAMDAVTFCCDGTTWRQITALLSNN